LSISSGTTSRIQEFETNQWVSTEVIENKPHKEVARPEGFEPPILILEVRISTLIKTCRSERKAQDDRQVVSDADKLLAPSLLAFGQQPLERRHYRLEESGHLNAAERAQPLTRRSRAQQNQSFARHFFEKQQLDIIGESKFDLMRVAICALDYKVL